MNISNAEQNSASITQLIFENNLENIFAEYDTKIVIAFLEKAMSDSPDFGKEGKYNYFCKECGGSWNFSDKTEYALFQKIHKITGCSLKWKESVKVGKAGVWGRGSKSIPPSKEKSIKVIIAAINKGQEDMTTLLSTETAVKVEEPKPDLSVTGAITV